MGRTRSLLENLSKEELIEELITVNDILSKLSDLSNQFNDFLRRLEIVSSELANERNCKALFLAGHDVKPGDLQACHHLKKTESVIVKFKFRRLKQSVIVTRKNLQNKSEDLYQLKFSGKLFISEHMCHEKNQLGYKCCQLKNSGKIHSTWFWNNVVNIKLSERSSPVNIFHIIDIEKLLAINNLDDFISNASFQVFSSPFTLCFSLYVLSLP